MANAIQVLYHVRAGIVADWNTGRTVHTPGGASELTSAEACAAVFGGRIRRDTLAPVDSDEARGLGA